MTRTLSIILCLVIGCLSSSLVQAQPPGDPICCSTRNVELEVIEKRFYFWKDKLQGVPTGLDIKNTMAYPAKRDEWCDDFAVRPEIPAPGVAHCEAQLSVTSPHGDEIHDGDTITGTAVFSHLGGDDITQYHMYVYAGTEQLATDVDTNYYENGDSHTLNFTHEFDFEDDTVLSDDGEYRIFEIRAHGQSELSGEFLMILARYHCKMPECNGPGPVTVPDPGVPNPCPTCERTCETGGASTVCPFPELLTNGSHMDFAVVTTPGLSGCSSCSGGSNRGPGNVPNSLLVNRKLIPANQVTIGNSSPGMYFVDMDLRLELYHDPVCGNSGVFFDPFCEKTVFLSDPDTNGVYSPDSISFGHLTTWNSQGAIAPLPSNAVTATISSHDGWEYEFEIASTELGSNHYGGRIKTITSPDGFVKTFTYKNFTQTEIDNDPVLQYQIDTVTDPSGNDASISYHATQQAGRWAISTIDINSGTVILNYDYNASGHLETVKKQVGTGPLETISTYTYGTDTLWNAAWISWDQRLWDNSQSKDTIYVSADYLLWDGELVNQFADNLLGRADGSGYRYMAVARHDSTPGLFRVEYRGQLVEWQQGSYWRYFTDWSYTEPGFDGYSGTLESSYAVHPAVTWQQMLAAQPLTLVDETGLSVNASYDDQGNIYRKHYNGINGSDFEQWLYDSKNRVYYYRDRRGYVTLTTRDARGLVQSISKGLEDQVGDESITARPEATQTVFGYYPANHPNEFLLKWVATNAYPTGGPVLEPSENRRTDFVYNNANELVEVIKPLPEGETTRPSVSYGWSGGQTLSMTDETEQITTWNRDSLNRIEETLYPDGSNSQTWRDEANRKTYVKDRNDIVTMTELDTSQRVYAVQRAYGRDPHILDGNISANAWYNRHDTVSYYPAGQTRPRKTVIQHASTETDYDYRGRQAETRRYSGKHTEAVVTTTRTYVNNLLFSTGESWPGYSKTTYNGYSADRLTVRKISTRIPTVTFADNSAVMNATRITGVEPDHMIADAIRDLRGNLVQVIDGRGTITMNTFDSLGRQTETVRAHGTSMALTSLTEYNAQSRVELTTDPAGMQTKTGYDDAGNVKTRTLGFGTADALVTSFTYDAKGRQKTVTSPSGGVTTSHYDDCCSNTSGSEDAYGFGSIRVANSGGRVVYQASVTDDFDFVAGNFLDPAAAETLSETTSRYHDDGRVRYTTRWKSARGQINPDSPPIAGISGAPAADGLTTQYVYFRSTQYNANNAKYINRVGGGTAVVKVKPAIDKLAEPVAQGGADMDFFYSGTYSSSRAQATLVIAPDEKTMQVTIVDGLGRTVLTGLMTGPAATTPNELITWNCTQFDQSYTLAGFGDTGRVNQIDRDGNFTSSLSDGFGQSIGSLDQDNHLARSKFDEGGSLRERVDANSNSVTYTYDDLGRQLTATNPAGTTTTNYNSVNGRVDSRIDAKNNTSSFAYDILGRQTTATDRLIQDTVRVYDSAGRLHTLTDAQSKTTTYTYDLTDRKLTTTYPDNSVVTNDYDPSGTFPVGSRAQKMTYDSGKSKTSISSFDGTVDKVEFRDSLGTLAGTDDYSYDTLLRRSGSTSMDGIVRALTYNDHGQLASDMTTYGGQSYTVSYGYDDQLRQNSITYPSGRVASYTHTNRGELDKITWAGTQIEDRLYDDVGRLTNIDRAFTDEVRTYDTSNRLLTIDNPNVGMATYSWDANNNKLGETWTGNMSGWSFTTEKPGGTYTDGYDEEDRFRRFIQSGQSNDIYLARTDIGNISNVQVNSTSHLRSYSDAHELTNVAGTAQTFDDDGNLTLTHNGTTLAWNDANRLAGTTLGSVTSDYKYDSDNKRVSKKVTDNSVVTEDIVCVYAGPNCIAEYDYGTAATSPNQEYVYGQGIDSLVLLSRTNNADQSVVTRNQQSSVTALVDASDGVVQERYTYDHFGNRTILAADGSTVRNASSYGMPYGYTSRRYDNESGLMYFRARLYDPTTGEFTSRDPLEYIDGMSMMRGYADFQGVDPSGLNADWEQPHWCRRDTWRYFFNTDEQAGIRFARRFGFHGAKVWARAEHLKCDECCNGQLYRKTRKSIAGTVAGELEVGSREYSFWKLKVRTGWYGRLKLIGRSYKFTYASKCAVYNFKTCVEVEGEIGLIASARIGNLEGGIRGGFDISLRLCFECNGGQCEVNLRLCGRFKVRVWGKYSVFGRWKVEYHRQWTYGRCTPPFTIARFS